MLIDNPLVLDAGSSYTFRSYFEMRFAPADILADLGCTFKQEPLNLPQGDWHVPDLKERIERSLPYVSLTSESARQQIMVAPLLIELAQAVGHSLRN